jgi:prepilin-type N-terminal cleavage/methylation domain-containing protein
MRRGISLIEVLTCMVILVILVSLLLPVATASRAKAKEIVCVSNLRQIGSALKMYQSDNGEYPPNSLAWSGLQTYIKAPFSCPERLEGSFTDYFLNASPLGNTTDLKEIREAWIACRDLRGSEFPISFDVNHASKLRSGGFYLILREDVSVHSVPTNAPKSGACDHEDVLGPWINH